MYEFAKRILDLALCVAILPIALPIAIVVAVAIACSLGRPVVFTQRRIGRGDRPFLLRKFRTMRPATGRGGDDDASRMTPLGGFLRSTSLDELPTIWNVLRGDMSLVGPRPLLPQYLPLYSPAQRRRHEVKPGVTGWAQVNGRNTVSWDERFALDVWYVDHRSMRLDLEILARTLGTVLSRKGVSAEGHVTMPPFTGPGGGT
jgi:lipopolysaccharide/colanic/teichoic acid biosynthesis glycosyltransferase